MAFWQSKYIIKLRPRLSYCVQVRLAQKLPSKAAVSALRSFYLSVHPDFFAQHPQIQKINESSLKRLNSYLEALQCTRQLKELRPTKVAFYFRKEEKPSGQKLDDFKLVNFTLHSHDLLTNVEHILVSCGLPATHLEVDVVKEARHVTEIPIRQRYRKTSEALKWNKEYFHNNRKDEEVASEISIRTWLRKNAQIISERQESSKLIRKSNEELKEDICLNFGLREIAWRSMWQHSSEQGILRMFARFCNQHKDEVKCLQGNKLVFTDRTMAAADESICINVKDVPQRWLQFLSKYHVFSVRFEEVRHLDKLVRENCGDIQIVRPEIQMPRFREHGLLSISDYLTLMKLFTSRLRLLSISSEGLEMRCSMRNHELTFVESQSPDGAKVTMLLNGRLRVDANCDPYYLLCFLIQNKMKMDERKYLCASWRARSVQLVELCQEKFGLSRLVKDFDVEDEKMSKCCERLLQNFTDFNAFFNGLELRITLNYYSLFDHGQFCIPWDWKI